MDKVLTRKLFRDTYLKSLNMDVSNFNKGGLASLRIHHFDEGGSATSTGVDPTTLAKIMEEYGPPYTEGQKQALLLAPIASALLTGTRQPGQSQLGAVASNVGAALPKVSEQSMLIKKLEDERLTTMTKAATVNLGKPTIREATAAEKKDLGYDPEDRINVAIDPRTGKPTKVEKELLNTSEELKKAQEVLAKTNILGADAKLRDLENYIQELKRKGYTSLPGIGPVVGSSLYPSAGVSEEGLNLQSKLAGFANLKLQQVSGSAVTDSEFNRFAQSIAGGVKNVDQNALLESIRAARMELESQKDKVLGSLDPTVVNKAVDRGMIQLYESPQVVKMGSKRVAADPHSTQIGQYRVFGEGDKAKVFELNLADNTWRLAQPKKK